MHTKTAALTLFALLVASNAAPVPNRLSRSDAGANPNFALGRRGSPGCDDEAPTYGLGSGKTEGDCANTPNATGFREGSISAICSIPVKGSGKEGICYLGGAAAQGRPPQDEAEATSAPEGGEGAEGSEKEPEEPEKEPEEEPEVKEPEDPTDQPTKPSGTPGCQSDPEQPPSAETPPQSPVKAPAPVESPPLKSSAPSATPPVTTNTPGITPPKPNGVPGKHNAGTNSKDDDMTWLGNTLFKMFGGLF